MDKNNAQSVTVIGKGDKERQIYLTPAAKSAVNAWLIERNNYHPQDNALFISNRGIRLTTRAIQIVIKTAVENCRTFKGHHAAQAPKSKLLDLLRHTAATLLYKHGHVDIRALKEILGHESLSTTQIYTHLDDQQLQTAVNMNPLAGMVNRKQQG